MLREVLMIQITFTDADIAALEYERYHHPSPLVQRRMEILYLKSQGLAHQEIARLCRVCRQTVVTTFHLYQQGGIERLKQFHFAGQPSELNAHHSSLEAEFRARPPRTIAEAQDTIERLTGIRRSPTQIRAFLLRLGMRVRKVGVIPGQSTNPDKAAEQDNFRAEQLTPRLEEVRQGKRTLFL
jgi:transposase